MDETDILFRLGPLPIREAIVSTWGIMAALWLCAWAATRRLSLEPRGLQTALEGVVGAMQSAVSAVLPDHATRVLPLVGTLWIYLVVANLLGIIPGLTSPTGNLSVTSGLALLVFLSVHWFGIRSEGLRRYLRHYVRPNPILLPFHVISEITRTVALAVRLFGNIMSLEMAALLILMVAGLFAPVPILMLHIVEALVQAYIFGTLALIYIAGALQAQEIKRKPREE